jgi:GntR family transcriptional repressor for pyruvate dehydrogenase complex
MTPKKAAPAKIARKKSTVRASTRGPVLKVPRAAEVLAAHLRQRIIRGELKEGDRLPKEQRLIETFGVSRSTFREAFLLLEAEGLISVARGTRSGALVHRPSVEAASRQMNFIMQAHNVTLDDVYRSLALIEPAVIRLLAERATKSDIAALRKQVKEMYDNLDDDHTYSTLAAQFHRSLVERAGPVSLTLIMDLLSSLIGAYVEGTTAVLNPVEKRNGKLRVMRTKEKLIEFLEKHDADAAEALWKKYFEATREVMQRWQPSKAVQDVYEFRA